MEAKRGNHNTFNNKDKLLKNRQLLPGGVAQVMNIDPGTERTPV